MTRRPCQTGRTLAMALTLSLSLSLAGCGNDDNADEGSSKASTGPNYAEKALTRAEFMPSVHAAAAQQEAAHVTVVMTAARAVEATGDVAFDSGGTRMNLTMQSGDQQLAMRLVEGQCYLQISGVTPPGKFLVVDPNNSTTMALTCAIFTDQMVPLVDLKAMKSAVQKVERVGKQIMDGVTVEEYKVTVDTASTRRGKGSETDAVKLPDTIEYHYWIDENNLTHRRFFKATEIDFDARMSRWGEPVEIQRPANGRVLTMPEA